MKRRFLGLLALSVAVPTASNCFFFSRKKRKKEEVLSGEFMKTEKVGNVLIVTDDKKIKGKKQMDCPTCAKSERGKAPMVEQTMRVQPMPMEKRPAQKKQQVVMPVQPTKEVVQEKPATKVQPVKTDKPEPKPEPKKEEAVKPVKEEVKEPAKETAGRQDLVEITTAKQYDEVTGKGMVVIDVYTDWCGQCKVMEPHLQKLAKKYDGKVVFAKVNGERPAANKIKKEEGINSYPQYFFYNNGKKVHKTSGSMPALKDKPRSVFFEEYHLQKAFPSLKGKK